MISKIHTTLWFLRRPELYSQLIYLFYQRLFPHPKENTREESTELCNKRHVDSREGIKVLTGKDHIIPLKKLYPSFFQQAEKKVRSVDVKMGGGADLDLLYYLSKSIKARNIIETGVAYGWSSSALLLSVIDLPDARVFSTDMPYPKMNNERYVGCVVPENLKSKWHLIPLPDRQALRQIVQEVQSFDICHYDSDKSYRGRMWAYPKLWKMINSGGFFISDDINDNMAFFDFADTVNIEPTVVYYDQENKYIGVLVKP